VSFRSFSGTWHAVGAGLPVITKGEALAFLNPITERGDSTRKAGEFCS
jgi:hypothetical protein